MSDSSKKLLFSITEKDLIIQSFNRGSGAGGQKRNKTSSAIRMEHTPSKTVVTCDEERSQASNKKKAFLKLVNSDSFKTWLKMEIAKKSGVLAKVEEEVNKEMKEENIRTEVKDQNGLWMEVQLEDLKDV